VDLSSGIGALSHVVMQAETESETMTEVILALNAGSTSLKFSLFATMRDKETLSLLYRGEIEDLRSEPRFLVYTATGQRQGDEQLTATEEISHEEALNVLLEWIERHEAGLGLIAAVAISCSSLCRWPVAL
jgi:acetate kinase